MMIIIVIGFCFVNPNRKAFCKKHPFSHFVKFRKAFLLKTFQMILRNNNQPVEKASQSLRPQAQIESDSFSPATCASEKILFGSQTCELCAVGAQRVRCGEPQPFQTRAQRSGSRLRACQKYFLTRSINLLENPAFRAIIRR